MESGIVTFNIAGMRTIRIQRREERGTIVRVGATHFAKAKLRLNSTRRQAKSLIFGLIATRVRGS